MIWGKKTPGIKEVETQANDTILHTKKTRGKNNEERREEFKGQTWSTHWRRLLPRSGAVIEW